ncbi:MAG: class I SAM-dependent methyltransferase [Actinomycetota bacterium]|nr:class I SAM-dependent methyltransferase [Actinomycetota bacterium]
MTYPGARRQQPDPLIEEQIAYYRERAAEYDATSSPGGDPFAPFGEEIERAVHDFAPRGDLLEIASGTGTWTKLLVQHADALTALDAAPEMHDQSRVKLGDDPRVRYVVADVFTWEPDRRYDVVFFANWLSHVPRARFDDFWEVVRASLKPGGRVFLVDEAADAWRREEWHEEFTSRENAGVVKRPLLDGRTFNVVKVFWEPDELKARLAGLGWTVEVNLSGPFLYATASRRE